MVRPVAPTRTEAKATLGLSPSFSINADFNAASMAAASNRSSGSRAERAAASSGPASGVSTLTAAVGSISKAASSTSRKSDHLGGVLQQDAAFLHERRRLLHDRVLIGGERRQPAGRHHVIGESGGEVGRGQHPQMRRIDRLGLLAVEPGRVAGDPFAVERGHQFLGGEDVPVLGQRPTEQGQIVDHALGDEPVVAVLEEVGLRIPLGKLLVALARDEGKVAELGRVLGNADVGQCLVQRNLTRGGRQQVLAAQHVGDAHQRVVDGIDQGVQGCPVASDHHRIGYRTGREADLTADHVLEGDVAVRHPQAQDGQAPRRDSGRDQRLVRCPVVVVVAQLDIAPGRPVARLGVFGGRVRRVQVPGVQQPLRDVLVDVGALALPVRRVRPTDEWTLVPVDPEPVHRLDQGLVGLFRVPGRVGVLDAEDQRAVMVPGEGPVEQCRSGETDVRSPGRRWAEPGTDRTDRSAQLVSHRWVSLATRRTVSRFSRQFG